MKMRSRPAFVAGLALLGLGIALLILPGAGLFGRPSVAVVHIVTALPFTFLLADRLVARRPIGARIAVMLLAILTVLAILWRRGDGGPIGCHGGRIAWCLTLLWPGCLLMAGGHGPSLGAGAGALLLAFVAAVGLSGAYVARQVEEETRAVEEALRGPRLREAQDRLRALEALGSRQPILQGGTPVELRRRLEDEIDRLTAVVAAPLPDEASAGARLQRAQFLAMLDRFDEAAEVLRPIADSSPHAAALLASIRQKQKRWDESNAAYGRTIELVERVRERGPPEVALLVRSYGGQAYNARETGDFAAAESAYREGLARVPEARAELHFQLGRHYHLVGRVFEAREHLDRAARLESTRYADAVAKLVEELDAQTPACLLPRGRR